ncbi:UvrD-helicase domain-containing protein [Actomonas aquatica]|uniref:DNA 3'-5' helicase n=1 Tax=Actomonas aquatica TaxID=2866162 RepID=A0ABZ1C5Z3_9BACT|nr:UvrD-helicase domain-containing protein [Opitutus sp. WL0086]WRQ86793.1 UvrD-helicase domain-containing protein [Opitutus sp. WL0086]
MSAGPGHVMILASAGAGKTYALTTRFVRLLAAGAEPARVVALTFTRKAAGEFFDDILNRLAGAAASEAAAERLAREIERPEWGTADFRGLLRAMIDAMPQLNLGTLDGFFSRMVQAFPLELGLSGEFKLLEEAEARGERQRVLGLIFAAGAVTEVAREDFIESFKRATYGVEEKALGRRLDAFLDEHGETYLSAPSAQAWGNARRIWPDGCAWLEDVQPMEAALARCQAAWPWAELKDKQRARLERFGEQVGAWSPGAAFGPDMEFVLKKALADWPALLSGGAELVIDRLKVSLGPESCAGLRGVVQMVVAAELGRRLEITQGIHAVLRWYDRVYDRQVRRVGKLTFGDVLRILTPEGPGEGAAALERDLIDWRLDARFDHWLLDEFQDTSRVQWSILKPLIDEAVQDPEGRRSFFYVGDVKQAIYGWRGGDARLFREIFDHYNAAQPGAVQEAHLQVSWRSGPSVIAMVNAVFGDEAALAAVLPEATVARWGREWRAHDSARPGLGGWAELREAADEAERFAETLRILREVGAAERGLTVAVLVQKNDTGARLAEYLRAEGSLAAVAESDLHVAFDNPLTSALLALVRAAAHPWDRFARGQVELTPVGAVLADLGWRDGERWVLRVLGEIEELGFGGALAAWVARLEPKLAADDAFSRLRARQVVDAARRFDENGGGSVAAFWQWMESFTLRETESPGVVRVMTVHKAKGLGFDMVIVPDLQGQSVDRRRQGLAVHRDVAGDVDWVMDLPAKLMVDNDEALSALAEEDAAESAYEALCRLYVALTRAKRALYVLVEPTGRSRSRNLPKLLQGALGDTWSDGDALWWQAIAEVDDVAGAGQGGDEPECLPVQRRRRRLLARTPSGDRGAALAGKVWFSRRAGDRAERGTAVHALLATIEWLNEGATGLAEWSEAQRAVGHDGEALAWLEHCLAAPELMVALAPPVMQEGEATVELWRERAFEVALADVWLSGSFDRVTVWRDAAGNACRAVVDDFKTDRVDAGAVLEERAQRYREQLERYRRVVGRLTGLPMSAVGARLVFLEPGRVISLG